MPVEAVVVPARERARGRRRRRGRWEGYAREERARRAVPGGHGRGQRAERMAASRGVQARGRQPGPSRGRRAVASSRRPSSTPCHATSRPSSVVVDDRSSPAASSPFPRRPPPDALPAPKSSRAISSPPPRPRPAPPRAQLDPSRSVWRSGVHAFDADTSDGTWGFAQASPTSITALVPVRPRSRGGRRSLRTSWTFPPGARISPPASRARSRRASTPRDAARRDPERTSFRSPRRLTKIPPVDRSSRSSSRAPPSARPTPASSATTGRRPSTREDASSCDGSARGAISTAGRSRPPARRSRRTRTISHWFPYDPVGVVNAVS